MADDWSQFEPSYNATTLDIELLKREVGQRFPFYDMKSNLNTAVFFCKIDEETLGEKFDDLRRALSEKGYIPMIRYEKGEHAIYVIKKPKVKKKPVWINIALLIATIFTTTLAGAIQWVSIYEPVVTSFMEILAKATSPFYLWNGFIFFSIPLLAILGIHEMGHYFISKRHNLETSLPFFIPLPPPFILGTFGALISTHEPIPNRKALLDVGVSGPICGFLVAIPVCIIGLLLTQQNPIYLPSTGSEIMLTFPLLLQGLSSFFIIPADAVIHPTLFAGWVGLFLTAINLLPVGQLDGGHVARALLKEKHKYASWAVVIIILGLGLFFTGWLFFAFIILFMIGTQHQPPLNEIAPLDTKRLLIGILAVIIFILCFAPLPMSV
jgi:membrane-associated protease RseP (regulator of RpoE activity)